MGLVPSQYDCSNHSYGDVLRPAEPSCVHNKQYPLNHPRHSELDETQFESYCSNRRDLRPSQLVLLCGYFRLNGCVTILMPMDIVFICYDYYILRTPVPFCLHYFHYIPKTTKSVMKFTLFQDSNIWNKKTHTIVSHKSHPMQYLDEKTSASCYVPNISDISANIPLDCAAIIRCGRWRRTQSLPSRLTLDYSRNDYCSATIAKLSHSEEASHGVEIELPTFEYSAVDDMIYYNSYRTKGVIAYRSFTSAPYNNLYLLDNQHSGWEILTKVSWSALSSAILCGLESQNKLFITTKAGESVICSLDADHQYQYQRASNMLLSDGNKKANVHTVAYNEPLNKIYRAINGNTYYFYDIYKNGWYHIPEMTMNMKYCAYIDNQTLFINPQSPYVLNTMVTASRISPRSYSNFKKIGNRKLFAAYFDERDTKQKWVVLSPSAPIR